ncbi:uncharacterized protein B0H18DRAFT_354149 [Fomitopsis serialis]|uniref:uncharacterized protein n=1 Tax=Fomitopsis serialis TaxID=139415 RepID=UPI002007E651|nr:uncharacterized protein B0H18DRAFT_354149 [Neoantrodia serialis]KAH9926223.1 hypothetical protein B0H18DRAFT_354149 [Neoantrodia serialis]
MTAQLPASTSVLASAPPPGQPTVPGPADPQTPVMLPKSSSTATVNRPHEQAYPDPAHQYEPYTYPAPSAEHPSHYADTSKRSRHANQGAQPSERAQQPSYGDSGHANAHNGGTAPSYLHPVQQAIRSVEGITRPPSTRPGAKASSASVPTAQAPVANTREYDRSYTQKSAVPGSSTYGQATGQQPQSTPQYSSSDVRLPGAYPSSPANAPQQYMHPGGGPMPGSYGIPGVARTNTSQTDEKTPRARPVELSVQYQTSTFPPAQNGASHDSAKMASVLPPTAHSITVAQATFTPARPPDVKAQWSNTFPGGVSSPPSARYADARPTQDGHVNQQGAGGHSPGRQPQSYVGRSPGVASTAPLDSTPRQYSASHLPAHRNGSTDTIQQSGASKYSPSIQPNQQTLNHRTSVGSLQPHASSRPDMTPTARPANVLSGYPEPPTRYRSPAPIPIPYRASSTAPNPSTPASQSYNTQPSSRPALPTSLSAPAHESSYLSPRGASLSMAQSQPANTRGYHQPPSTDYSARTQDAYNTSGQRPPRSAPPLAPTVNTKQHYDVSSPANPSSVIPPSSAPPRSSTFPHSRLVARRSQAPSLLRITLALPLSLTIQRVQPVLR